jgi:hypothetical protein
LLEENLLDEESPVFEREDPMLEEEKEDEKREETIEEKREAEKGKALERFLKKRQEGKNEEFEATMTAAAASLRQAMFQQPSTQASTQLQEPKPTRLTVHKAPSSQNRASIST